MGSSQAASARVWRFDSTGATARPEIQRPDPALLAVEHVEADVGGDPVEPGPHRRTAFKAVTAPPGAHEHILDGVLGIEGRPEHAVAIRGQLRPVLLQPAKGGRDRDGRFGH